MKKMILSLDGVFAMSIMCSIMGAITFAITFVI